MLTSLNRAYYRIQNLFLYIRPRAGIHYPICTTSPILQPSKHQLPLYKDSNKINSDDSNNNTSNLNNSSDNLWSIWFNSSDICGLICIFITYFLLLFSSYVITYCILVPWYNLDNIQSYFHWIAFNYLVLISIFSHYRAMTTDPGVIPNHTAPIPNTIELSTTSPTPPNCPNCSYSYKPPRSHHCSICHRCIYKMDHHCPWINNCVGIGNQKYFILFCFYVMITCGYAGGLVGTRLFTCNERPFTKCFDSEYSQSLITNTVYYPTSYLGFILCLVLGVILLIFGLFTVAMFCTQVYSLLYDATQIEQWQEEREKWRKKYVKVQLQTQENNLYNNRYVPVPIAKPLMQPLPFQARVSNPSTNNNNRAVDLITDNAPSVEFLPLNQLHSPDKARLSSTLDHVAEYASHTLQYASSYPPSTVDADKKSQQGNDIELKSITTTNSVDESEQSSLLVHSSVSSLSSAPSSFNLPPRLSPVTGLSNVSLVCIGSSSYSFFSSPYSFVYGILSYLLPVQVKFPDFERMCGYTTSLGPYYITPHNPYQSYSNNTYNNPVIQASNYPQYPVYERSVTHNIQTDNSSIHTLNNNSNNTNVSNQSPLIHEKKGYSDDSQSHSSHTVPSTRNPHIYHHYATNPTTTYSASSLSSNNKFAEMRATV